ncbi:MAG TPA: tetratricopeptide repeat protein [Symbiobacteriaceae bacterium]|nr:tetratricopeptide repeat protein [Symbiobacteriaceae bacterium]
METQVLEQLERAHKRGEYGRVIFTCEQLLANPAYAPHRALILFWKGMSHYKAGQAWRGEAISCLREAMASAGKDRPTKARIMVALGMVYAYMGDCVAYAKMLKEWDRIARDNTPDVMRWGASFWYNYGCTLDNAFRYAEAIEAYKRALDLCHWSEHLRGDCYHNLGGSYLYSGDLSEAMAAMEHAEPLFPDQSRKLSRRAEYALAVKDLSAAQQYITEALVHPQVDDFTRADVYFTWAQLLLLLDRPREAREKALQALNHAIRVVFIPCIHKTNMLLQRFGPSPQ